MHLRGPPVFHLVLEGPIQASCPAEGRADAEALRRLLDRPSRPRPIVLEHPWGRRHRPQEPSFERAPGRLADAAQLAERGGTKRGQVVPYVGVFIGGISY
jgi:hypothetical protein